MTCRDCRWWKLESGSWQPRNMPTGACLLADEPESRFWAIPQAGANFATLYTQEDFACADFSAAQPQEEGVAGSGDQASKVQLAPIRKA